MLPQYDWIIWVINWGGQCGRSGISEVITVRDEVREIKKGSNFEGPLAFIQSKSIESF